ncbi:MAG: aryl-alcohol dehydrogenase [Betaproteobacteria bacterium]|nr:aryl-alcohol dehydrogenase [Betaproteobacteria bacterium]
MNFGLGTAQFGFDYGISNARGRVPKAEVERILRLAADSGFDVLDTAPAYGECEATLGELLWDRHPFRIVTKVPALTGCVIERKDAEWVKDTFKRSLENMRQSSVHGLLLHQVADLFKPGGELLAEALLGLRNEGLTGRIGASFYAPTDIRSVNGRMQIDIAQVPVNLLDQRLIADGTLAALQAQGIEIHARSVFLQGLLLMDLRRLPPQFARHHPRFEQIRHCADRAGISAAALALAFARQIAQIDTVLTGVTTEAELREIIAASAVEIPGVDFAEFSSTDETLLNPSLWPMPTSVSNA